MMLSAMELAKIMTQQDREEMLVALGSHFDRDSANLKAIAERSKIKRLSGYPAPTPQEINEAKSGRVFAFLTMYRNRVNAGKAIKDYIGLRDAKDVHDLIRNNL